MLIAFFDLSTPIPLALISSFNKDIKIHPEPVPMSKILKKSFLLFMWDNIKSINTSVSGLGIRTERST